MSNVIVWLSGKKTYLLMGVSGIVIIINHFAGPIPGIGLDPNQWMAQLMAVASGASLRAGVKKVEIAANGAQTLPPK